MARRILVWLRRLGLGLLGLVLLTAMAIAGAVWWTLPAAEASPRLPGLAAPVDISLDRHGIPRIAAGSERDAAMALGWLHARDRMFQMDMTRRGAAGRLAEIVGGQALRSDRFVRTLGLARRAAADLAALPPETRDILDAYAEGVNAWIAAKGRFAAPEFLVLGPPEPWRPEHSLLWGKVMGLWLSGNWRTELARARLATILPPERLADLWPMDTTPGRPYRWSMALDPGRLERLAATLPRFPETGTLPASASNAWAVSGGRSASGAPLLASDPHLGFQAPILWYLARIDLPDGRMLAGATSPGVPFMVIGRNARLAWGFTTTHSDTQDVFIERLVGSDRYETPDGPQPFTIIEETIGVRGGEPVTLRVRETRHGPVISDLDAAALPAGTVLAVAMANLAPADTAAAGLLALNRADSVAGARAAAALITSPSQNLMAADTAGRIAMFLTGRTPLRRAGDGTLPAAGTAAMTGSAGCRSMPCRMPRTRPPACLPTPTTGWCRRSIRSSSAAIGMMIRASAGSARCWPPARSTMPKALPPCSETPCPCSPATCSVRSLCCATFRHRRAPPAPRTRCCWAGMATSRHICRSH
jgi:penicillin amidase